MKRIVIILLFVLAFAIPFEHKYDKPLRHFSLSLIPKELVLSKQYDKKLYFYASDIIAIALLFLCRMRWQKLFGHFLWIVFACATISIVLSPFLTYFVAYSRLLQLLAPILICILLSSHFKEERLDKITQVILLAICSAGIIEALIATAQYFNQAPLGLRLLNEYNPFGYIEFPQGQRWIFDKLSGRSANTSVMRAFGTLSHPNALGGFLCVSLLTSYYWIAKNKKWVALAMPLQMFALSITYSRSAFFAWILSTAVFLSFCRKRLLIASIAISFVISAFLLHDQIIHRGGIVNYNATAKASDAIRLEYQKNAFDIIRQNSFFGVGFDQFSERTNLPTAPHNIFLFMASEIGLIALGAFLCWIGTIFIGLLKSPQSMEKGVLSAIFIAFLFIGCCDFYPILFQQGRLLFFITAGLLAAHVRKRHAVSLSKEEVWKMFDQISPTYDRVNRVLSLGMDRLWRRKVTAHLPSGRLKVLDLATGTGDQAIALLKNTNVTSITGIDLAAEMLQIARKKQIPKTEFIHGDCTKLPFSREQFDAATFSFGIRNVPDPVRALQEIYRVLTPKGRCLVLEFSHPPKPLQFFYFFYLRNILPLLGGLLSRNTPAYRYLNQTIEQFPSGPAFLQLMHKAGFTKTRQVKMVFGGVSLYIGDKL